MRTLKRTMQMPRDNFSHLSPGLLMSMAPTVRQRGKATPPSVRASTPGVGSTKANLAPAVGVVERRRRRRVPVPPMYTGISLRNLVQKLGPIEGHVLDISETGIAVEADSLVPLGQVVTVEFQVAGIGNTRREEWPVFAAVAEVVRHDDVEDFPQGPYKMALRFIKVSTMAQAQIARFVATRHD